MNKSLKTDFGIGLFLNGVCRHEQWRHKWFSRQKFLNGVCRHEQLQKAVGVHDDFLNGVCRHEQFGGS